MNKEILEWINNQIKGRTSLLSRMGKSRSAICISPESVKKDLKILNQIKKELEEKDIMNYAKFKCECETAPVLDDVEKRYLKNVIRPFKDKCLYVCKTQSACYRDSDFIYIKLNAYTIMFPYFKKGTMYKNMEAEKAYTLEELGIKY